MREVNAHLGDWLAGEPPEVEALDATAWVEHALLAGLRTVGGLDLSVLAARAGVDVGGAYGRAIDELVIAGLLCRDGTRVGATPRGLATLDAVTARLLG